MITTLLASMILFAGGGLPDSVGKYLAEKDEAKAEKQLKSIMAGKPAIEKVFEAAEAYVPTWKHPGVATLFYCKVGKADVGYRLLVPKNVKPGTRLPLLFALPPGEGKEQSVEEALSRYWREEGLKRNFLVLSPIGRDEESKYQQGQEEVLISREGDQGNLLLLSALLKEIFANYPVDRDKVYLVGQSRGGVAGFHVALRMGDLFQSAAFIPGFAAGDQEALIDNLKPLPTFLGVGADDEDYWTKRVAYTAKQFEKIGGVCEFKEYQDQEHVLKITPSELFDWLTKHKRTASDTHLLYLCAENLFPRREWIEILDLDSNVSSRNPARVEAEVLDGNVISLKAKGTKKLRLYLKHGSFDFEQPITVLQNGNLLVQKEVKAEPEFFLRQWKSDLLRRGRYVAQIDVDTTEKEK